MANNLDQHNASTDSQEKIQLKFKDYSNLFEKCENASDVFSSQSNLYQKYNVDTWMKELKSMNRMNLVSCLFNVPNSLCKEKQPMQRTECVTLIQFYSLLENVFRNVLLRPYVPAYRTINKDCGRYRCFIKHYETLWPFKELQFECDGSNLLTYKGTNQDDTIIYALTCAILSQYFILKLERLDKNPNSSKTTTQ